jgi:D-xylose transport system substrate-binding protein
VVREIDMKTLMVFASAVALVLLPGFASAQLKVGVSWSGSLSDRWRVADGPAIRAAVEAAGAEYVETNAQSSARTQLDDINNLIAKGVDALIVVAQAAGAVRQAVQNALDADIPVIAYDRLIEMPQVLYITFDNREVGRMQARALLEQAPTGNYVFLKGDQADKNAAFVYEGQFDILQPPIDAGAIRDVGDRFNSNWDPTIARRNMAEFLAVNNDDVDAVVASNDRMAGGAVAALAVDGLAGSVAVSGQDGDAAALNRIALGTQTVSVWKDARLLGKAAGEAAVELARGTAPAAVSGAVVFDDGPAGIALNAVLLAPVPITGDNLDIVIDAGWITRDKLCQGVPAGNTPVCG